MASAFFCELSPQKTQIVKGFGSSPPTSRSEGVYVIIRIQSADVVVLTGATEARRARLDPARLVACSQSDAVESVDAVTDEASESRT